MVSKIAVFIWSIIVGTIIGAVFLLWFYDFDTKTLIVARTLTSALIFGSLIMAVRQFKFNKEQAVQANEWNKKQLAITQMHASKKIIASAINDLHGHLEIMEQKDPFPLEKVHDAMGVRLDNGVFVFHGEASQDHVKQVPDTQSDHGYSAIKFEDNIDGRKVKDTIVRYIGELEYISSGVNNEIFDEKTVKDLMRYSIVRCYIIFYHYIKHLQQIHGNIRTYKEVETLAKKFMTKDEEEEFLRNIQPD